MNLQKKKQYIKACSIRKCPMLSDTSSLPCFEPVIYFNDYCIIRIYFSNDNAFYACNCAQCDFPKPITQYRSNIVFVNNRFAFITKEQIIHGKLKNRFIIFLFSIWFLLIFIILIKHVILSTLFVYIRFRLQKKNNHFISSCTIRNTILIHFISVV